MKLGMSVAVFERKMHKKNRTLVQLQLNDQAFNALFEVMETLATNSWRGEESVALFANDRHMMVERAHAVFALINRVVTEGPS
ncbi:MAG TPA: hypothetical protein VJA26_16145, partial [Gammaproteobacteria bacterium]|nr:hypothetical protein [Gammaproteobacteria bacterium]